MVAVPHTQFGAAVIAGGVLFRVHAPDARRLRLVLHEQPAASEHDMYRTDDGFWTLSVWGIGAGQRYSYRMDDSDPRPDPASRFQPEGVHGPSEVVAPCAFAWTDESWRGIEDRDLVIYELHVGTFTPEGTFTGVIDRLPYLRDLGVTAIELMPVADFAGTRNWGYDGVALFAPSRAYGRPDDLRALVDRAHALGLAVILDVVYNHLGPEGAYLPEFNRRYLCDVHHTPWGRAVNLDAPGSEWVRQFLMDNALHWIREYHVDGLRFDATHALIDGSSRHFIGELAWVLRSSARHPLILHAEDHRNLSHIVSDSTPDGWGLDGVWADDFHHVLRRMMAGDCHSYYADFEGTTEELARTIRQGWLFTGEHSAHLRTPRGTDPSRVPMNRFVVCVQNHDQIGNRALGERLHHDIDAPAWRAASTILLTAPMTPLLFMGQEWAASTPFRFFSDFNPELGPLVTEGRRAEFRDFPQFSTPALQSHIPDPQAPETFASSRLEWGERNQAAHATSLALYRRLLQLRRSEPALQSSGGLSGEAYAIDESTIAVRRTDGVSTCWVVARLRGSGTAALERFDSASREPQAAWVPLMTTEDPGCSPDPAPTRITFKGGAPVVQFARPGAVVFKNRPAE